VTRARTLTSALVLVGFVGAASACSRGDHVAWSEPAASVDPHAPLPAGARVEASPTTRHATLDVVIDCRAKTKPISPDIYGIGYDITGFSDGNDGRQWLTRPSGRRFGGNASSRYNWELGTYNHGSDWLFANGSTSSGGAAGEPMYARFLREDVLKGATSAVTIPILGWVAKDATSVSFPLAKYPQQHQSDAARGAGDGRTPAGANLGSPPPTDTSVAASPEMEGRWVARMAAGTGGAAAAEPSEKRIYILDNEPGLWNSTHRDVHPDAMTYDELLSRTVAYAHEVRAHDPRARIAGPSAYGWPDYFFSGRDAKVGFRLRPDRRLHGDLPILAYYLRELHKHEQETGERLLDLLDVHFYPQSDNIGIGLKGGVDPVTAAVRVRSPRALWDPTYADESWIKEPVRLLPRLREWIDQYYPGVGIEIGEWNYGAEQDMSAGLATAETLGRFADGGVTSAFYWTYPAPESPAAFAFRAFRDFDGHGGRFLDALVPARVTGGLTADNASVWVSRDVSGKHLVVVVLGFTPDTALDAQLHVESCGTSGAATTHVFTAGAADFAAHDVPVEAGLLKAPLPAYAITTIDLHLQ
jgi:hypothetical protein